MDFERIVNSRIYSFFDKLYILVAINLLWFFLSVFGLGIFTLFPATLAVFVLINSLIKESNFPILKSFYKVFVKDYWKVQKVFIVFLAAGIVLYFNIRVYYSQLIKEAGFMSSIGLWISCILLLIYFLAFIQLFFIFMYFPEFKTFKTVKYAVLFALAFPFRTLAILLLSILALFLMYLFPILIPVGFLVLFSLIVYLAIALMRPKFEKILPNKKALDVYDYID